MSTSSRSSVTAEGGRGALSLSKKLGQPPPLHVVVGLAGRLHLFQKPQHGPVARRSPVGLAEVAEGRLVVLEGVVRAAPPVQRLPVSGIQAERLRAGTDAGGVQPQAGVARGQVQAALGPARARGGVPGELQVAQALEVLPSRGLEPARSEQRVPAGLHVQDASQQIFYLGRIRTD
ncbi:unnamed protein product [Pieris brassicae]|uniref:Uncharacterized protein n=1 Tax=Pieris brassicae TaxID=7116 RepID=A0A9P0TMM8_PIEBR|nr:unnamed protein product [Pieris brassicae]